MALKTESPQMSKNKFYIWDTSLDIDPFDFKRGKIYNKDIINILNNNIEFLYLDKTIIDKRFNKFLILNYLEISEFKPSLKIDINKKIKNFCTKNNIKIVVSFTREFLNSWREDKPDSDHLRKLDNIYYMFNRGYYVKGYDLGISFFDHAYNLGFWNWKGNIEYNKPIEKTKKFSIVPGVLIRSSRTDFVLRLIRDNLHTHPEILFTKIKGKDIRPERISSKELKEVYEKNKLYIEEDTFLEDNMNISKLYKSSFEWTVPDIFYSALINVVFETRPYARTYGSLTEKTWKPIMAGIPFIWISFPHQMKYLQSLGYKFYSFIDYTFDSIEDDDERHEAVYNEFKRLNELSLEQLKEMVDSESHITEHNKNVFYNRDYRRELMNVFSTVAKI